MNARRAFACWLLLSTLAFASDEHEPAAAAAETFALSSIALPGAASDGVAMDYLAVDREHHRIWVPAGGTGRVDVIETKTQELHPIEKFATAVSERLGKKRMIGPSAATVGNGFVYIGNRADSSVCAVNAATLARGGCATIPSGTDGVAYVAITREVWVTSPPAKSLYFVDIEAPNAPKLAGSITLDGEPEGYAVDDAHGAFYTNLEDKDRTLRIDAKSRKVTATWYPACGEAGPRGLAIDPTGQFLMVACPDHVEVMDTAHGGKILSKLETGAGVDNIDYLPETRTLYVAAGRAGTITLVHVDEKGALVRTGGRVTAIGARNAVADAGIAYVADGPEGKILVVKPTH